MKAEISTEDAARLALLKTLPAITNAGDLALMQAHGGLRKSKPAYTLAPEADLGVYKLRSDIGPDSSFYIASGTGMYRYPDAFKVIQKLALVREDPDTPTLDMLAEKSNTIMIAKVMGDDSDNVRLLFADPESDKIWGAVSSADSLFNSCDVGVTMTRTKDAIRREYCRTNLGSLYPMLDLTEIRHEHGLVDSGTRCAVIREQYIKQFVEGVYEEMQLKCFKFTRKTISYSDTVIACSWEALRQALVTVSEAHSHEFTGLFTQILRAGLGHTFTVNGTDVQVTEKRSENDAATFYYVNGYRISSPDLTEVLEHSLCFPGDTKIYNSYLATVSKVSLKFHRAVAKGIPLRMHTSELSGITTAHEDIRRPGGMSSSDQQLEINIRVNKTFGVRTNFDFLGKTRYMAQFDSFVRNADLTKRLARGGIPEPNALMAHASFVRRVLTLDRDLMPDSRFLPDLEIVTVQKRISGWVGGTWAPNGVTISVSEIANTVDNISKIQGLYAQFQAAFSEGLEQEHAVLKRSHELLCQVMKETGATCVEDDDEFFYKVTGLSGTRYKINESTAAVSLDSSGGDHICIVKAANDIDGYDYIASLIMALSQDKFTARNIHTLAAHVKKAA